jgi:outer membrane receptor protein involved in Fe transport
MENKNRKRLWLIRVVPAFPLLFTTNIAAADPQQNSELDEIVVTAQKRSERINDVPLSITAISGDQLEREGITSPEDLVKVTPGLTVQHNGNGVPILTLRGIGFFENTTAVAPTVSIYVDQVPLPYTAMTEGAALDVERVEVLKGPQGTLFGQNSTGGAINYIAAKPTDSFEAGGEVGYGRYNEVDADGYISGPIGNNLTLRLAARTEQRTDGWQHTYVAGDDRALGKRDFTSSRLLLDWTPSDKLKFELSASGWLDKSDNEAAQFIEYAPLANPGEPEQAAALTNYPRPPANNINAAEWYSGINLQKNVGFYQISLRADWEAWDGVTITSISSYSNLNSNVPVDNEGVNFSDIDQDLIDNIWSGSQELRIASSDTGIVKWMIGGNYQHTHADENAVYTNFYSSNSGIELGPYNIRYHNFDLENDQVIDAKAAFGSLDYKLTDSITAQGSVRYTSQDDSYHGCLNDTGVGDLAGAFSFLSTALSGSPTSIAPGSCVTLGANNKPVTSVTSSLDQDNTSWRIGLDWKVTPEAMLYANITRGFKAGSFSTLPAAKTAQLEPVPQESLLALETGFKTSWLNHKLQLNGAVFYYDYTDKQILGYVNTGFPFGNLPGLVTIPKSEVAGGETDISWRPIAPLRFTGGATYIYSRVRSDYVTSDPLGAQVDIKGEAFPDTPKWAFLADSEYDVDLTDDYSGFYGVSATYRTASNASVGDNALFTIPSYTLIDMRAGIESSDGHWRLQLYGHNITNQFYPVAITHIADTVARNVGMGATYGLTIGYRF